MKKKKPAPKKRAKKPEPVSHGVFRNALGVWVMIPKNATIADMVKSGISIQIVPKGVPAPDHVFVLLPEVT
jgi:hypothetical protein